MEANGLDVLESNGGKEKKDKPAESEQYTGYIRADLSLYQSLFPTTEASIQFNRRLSVNRLNSIWDA